MKRKLLAVILTPLMVASLLSTAAIADGGEEPNPPDPGEPGNGYTLTLNDNYPGAINIMYANVTTMELPSSTRYGYLFLGWAETSTGEVAYRAGDPITLTSDKTLYAVWFMQSLIGDIPVSNGGYVYIGGIRWRVIGVKSDKWLLISADVLGGTRNWNDAKNYCGTVYDNFSGLEQGAVLDTNKTDIAYVVYAAVDLSNAKLFLLSASEAVTYFSSNDDRLPGNWWLRSPDADLDKIAGLVNGVGILYGNNVKNDDENGVRPAFQLDRNAVLFESAAAGGKSTAAEGGGDFGNFRASSENGRKLTLLDGSRSSFTASVANAAVAPGGTMAVTYSGAGTGSNEYVSAMICNTSTGEALYYASLTSAGSGTWDMTIPAELGEGSYTLKLFSEQQNGDYYTDYASAPTTVTLTVNEPVTEPKFASHSLVLSGQIGVNFFMDLRALSDEERVGTYMTFAISGRGSVSSEPVYFDASQMNSDALYHKFTCYVNAIQMADTITATYHWFENGAEKTVSENYSIRQYISTFDTKKESYDATTVALVHALADYGHYVQIFLDAHNDNWSVGKDYARMDLHYADSYDINAIKAAVAGYAIVKDDQTDGDLTAITYSLALDSETAIRVNFKPSDEYTGTPTVTVDNQSYTATETGGKYVVVIPKISAHKLINPYVIRFTTDRGTATVTVSALSYVKTALGFYTDADSQNAMAAIYAYSKATQDYRAAH